MSRSAVLIAFAALSVFAQTASSPHFEAATIKVVDRRVLTAYHEDGQMVTYPALPLTNYISEAYSVGLDQIQGPDWLATEFYAITAKLPDGPKPNMEERRQMMANLLTERFGLVFHRTTKEVPGYELVVAPGGPSPKLTASTGAPPPPPTAPAVAGPPERLGVNPEGFPVLTANQIWASTNGDGKQRFTFRRRTMHAFASDLRMTLSRLSPDDAVIPIEDKTGLAGPFDFHLEIPAGPQRLPPALRLQMGQMATSDDAPPVGPKEVSAALEKQLGLRLNPVKVPLDYIVVDKVNKVPTDN
jgi:uncharacterized protein (TIGR03435 family)